MCARFASSQNTIVGLFESGTYSNASGNFWPGLVQNHVITPSEGTFPVRYLGGTGRDVDLHVQGPKLFEGELTLYPQDFRFLAWTLGSQVDAGSPSPYSHLITALDNNVGTAFTSGPLNPFLSFGVEETGIAPGTGTNFQRTIKGCIVDEWVLEGTQGEGPLTNTVRYIGTSGAYTSGAASTINNFNYGTGAVGSIVTRPFIFSDVTLSVPSGTIWSPMTNFSLAVRNNLITRHYLTGSRDAAAPQPDTRGIMLNLGFDAHSENAGSIYETFFQGGSDFNVFMRINASTGSRDFVIALSGCRVLDSLEAPFPLAGINPWAVHLEAKEITASGADLLFRYNPW